MKKFILILLTVFGCVMSSEADIVTIDITGWSQEQRNFAQANIVKVLFDNGVTYDRISVSLPTVEIINPVGSLSVLTRQSIETEYLALRAKLDIANAAAAQERQRRELELKTNALSRMPINNIDAHIDSVIDSATNITEMKAAVKILLKRIVRYIKSQEE